MSSRHIQCLINNSGIAMSCPENNTFDDLSDPVFVVTLTLSRREGHGF